MARYQVELSPDAELSLREIYGYTEEQFTKERAEKHHNALINRMKMLAELPNMGRSREDLAPGYRSLKEGRYLILYTIKESRVVYVANIVHERRDLRFRLFKG